MKTREIFRIKGSNEEFKFFSLPDSQKNSRAIQIPARGEDDEWDDFIDNLPSMKMKAEFALNITVEKSQFEKFMVYGK